MTRVAVIGDAVVADVGEWQERHPVRWMQLIPGVETRLSRG